MVHLHHAQANLTFSAIILRTIKKKSRNALLYNIATTMNSGIKFLLFCLYIAISKYCPPHYYQDLSLSR